MSQHTFFPIARQFFLFSFENVESWKHTWNIHGMEILQMYIGAWLGRAPWEKGRVQMDGQSQAEPGVQRRHRCSVLRSSKSVPKNCALRHFMLVGQFSLT